MRRVARIVCPLASLLIVVSTFFGVLSFDPEPEATTTAGIILLLLFLAGSQLPLALAPFVSGKITSLRFLLAAGMLPSAVAIVLIAVDLAPRTMFSRPPSPGLIALIATGTFAYALAFLTLRNEHAA